MTTRNGHLLTYLVMKSPKVELNLLKHDHNFSSQPVVQIDTAPFFDDALLFSLSNNVIKIYKIDGIFGTNVYSSYKMLYLCSRTSGATLFAINKLKSADNSSIQFCVIVQRKMYLYNWKNNDVQQHRNFFEFESIPKEIIWYKSSICIGFSTGFAYSIYDVSSPWIMH